MRAVVLTGGDPTAVHLVRRLRATDAEVVVVRVQWRGRKRKQRRRRKRRTLRRVLRSVDRRLQDAYLEWRFRRLLAGVADELFGGAVPPLDADHEASAADLRSGAYAETLRTLDPDLLVVNGAPILHDDVFRVPRLGTLNVHFGVAPWYRGSFTLFWALYHGDLERTGATLHYVDAGLDTGPVVGWALPRRSSTDREATLMAASAVEVSTLVLRCVAHLDAGGTLTPLDIPGRDEAVAANPTYRKRHRRPWFDLALWWRRIWAAEAISLPPRIVTAEPLPDPA